MNHTQIITMESGKRSGKHCVRGLRITVADVFGYLASGMSQEEVLSDFPELTQQDILACLAFAADSERKLFANDPLLSGVGIAKELWVDEHTDEYTVRIRKEW